MNAKNLIEIQSSKRKPTLEEMSTATVVFVDQGFNAQTYNDDGPGRKDVRIYYIPKYETVFTQEHFECFLNNHPDELFLLVSDYFGYKNKIWAYVQSEPNNISLLWFMFNFDIGKMQCVARINNISGTTTWDKDSLIIYDKNNISEISEDQYRWRAEKLLAMELSKDGNRAGVIINFYIVGGHSSNGLDTNEILKIYLQLPNQTRIITNNMYNEIEQIVSVSEKATKPVIERYGLDLEDDNYMDYINQTEYFDSDANLDESTWDRIKNHLTNAITNNHCKKHKDAYYSDKYYNYKDILVISSPVGIHKRPTYHYITIFNNCGASDIVELARGELLMKDMTPVNCYYLTNKGKYVRITHQKFHNVKEQILSAEVDRVSFEEWNESKSIHPNLLKAVTAVGTAIHLDKVKLFNRVPFGALCLEHLIKNANYQLAESIAEYITQRGDNMNYVCSSLNDIFPGCNPMGSSLLKVFNMNKPCYDLLMEQSDATVDNFIVAYKAIKQLIPTGVLTKDSEKLYRQYMELHSKYWDNYSCQTGRSINIIDFPDEIKSIYKMYYKITHSMEDWWDSLRSYQEIVHAYFQFKDFGWDPNAYQIFIEFGLGDPSETYNMIRSREHAANEALAVYENKINEVARQKAEAQYAFRKPTLHKLETTTEMAKKSETGLLKNYSVIMPTQIYGEDVIGSIEKEGADMDHCVYRIYANQVAKGSYTVLYLRLANNLDQSLVTIGITKEGRINQTYGKHDSAITAEQARAIIEWSKQLEGKVTFKSESTDVMPGGWPRNITIPDLPNPNPEWLEKLAKVK